MATEANRAGVSTPPPGVFVRTATGLRKEAGTFDIFVYNTNNQNIGLGVAFLFLAVGAYAGGILPLSAVIAVLLVIPLYMVYSKFSADMPRSGGDYVWTSRIFGIRYGPVVGVMLAWTWIILAVTAIGAPAAFFAQLGVAGWMRSLGVATGAAAFTSIGDWVSGEVGTIVVGTLLLLLFTFLLIRGVRTYMRVQNITFMLAIFGVVLEVIAALITSHSGYATAFNSYVVAAGGKAHAYQLVMANAPHGPSFSLSATFFAMLWTLYMVLFGATSCYIGGEVRRAGTTQRRGMIGSLILTGVAIALLVALVENTIGIGFLQGLSRTSPAALGLSFTPNYNELLTIGLSPSLFWVVALGLTFLFWTYVWMPINYFTATRLMLALSMDRYLPASLSKVHERYATPHIAILTAFVLGEVGMILYVIGILSVITLLWAGVLMFSVTGVAAILYPSRLPAVWQAHGGRKFLGIPTIRIWGLLLVPAMLITLWILWSDPAVGIGHSWLQIGLNTGLPVSGVILFMLIWAIRRRSGVDVRLSAAEIPPE